MIDKIFEMIMEEARSRKGPDLSLKLCSVVQDLDVKIMDTMAELNEHFMDWLPDDPEELGKVKDSAFLKEVKRRYDR
ncbi:hypothetical protein ES702_06232 [subsurface metagenome]